MNFLQDFYVECGWTPRWKVEDLLDYADKIPFHCICRAIISDERYRTLEIISTLDSARVKDWGSIMKPRFLNAFSGGHLEVLSKFPLFTVLLQDPDIKKNWTPDWQIEYLAKWADKIPFDCIYRAILANEKHRVPEIVYKLDPGKVKELIYWMKTDFLKVFRGKNFNILHEPLISSLLQDSSVDLMWTFQLEVKEMIQYAARIPSDCVGRAITAQKKHRIPEIVNKIDPGKVKDWAAKVKVGFLHAFNGRYFKILPEPLIDALLQDSDVKDHWRPRWKIEYAIKYFEKIPSRCICRAIIAYDKYRTHKILERLTVDQIKEWEPEAKRAVVKVLKNRINIFSNEVKSELKKWW